MERYVHRPVEVDAVRWDGDLTAVRDFITGDTEAYRDTRSDVLWVTQHVRGRRDVFPVALHHWLVRDARTSVLSGMSPRQFEDTYAIVAA